MPKRIKYVQCSMKRTVLHGHVRTTSYLPQRFAKVGRVVKLRNDADDEWTDGWVVEFVGSTIVDESRVPDYRKAIRSHRKLTGDSLRRDQ